MKTRLATIWNFLRTLATDDAYERYVDHHKRAHTGSKPLDRRQFYLREQRRKWSGINRCC